MRVVQQLQNKCPEEIKAWRLELVQNVRNRFTVTQWHYHLKRVHVLEILQKVPEDLREIL